METPEIQITSRETAVIHPTVGSVGEEIQTNENFIPVTGKDVQILETAVVPHPIIEDRSENSENNEDLVLEGEVLSKDIHSDEISEADTEKSLKENEEKITPEEKLIQAMNEFGEKVDGLKEAMKDFSQTLEAAPKNFENFNQIFTMLLMRLEVLEREYQFKKAQKGEDHPETQLLKQKVDRVQYMIGMLIGFIMGQALSY